jgi:hypothetical protein
MAMISERWMEITFSEGRKLRFKFPVQATEETAAQRMEEVLKLPTVTISTGEQLFVIPTAAIQSIVITPAPRKLPRSVIRAAKLVS